MSKAIGAVRFPDDTIMYCEYFGTSDYMDVNLYPTLEEYDKRHLRKYPTQKDFELAKKDEQEIEIMTTYGGGTYWKSMASKSKQIITGVTFYGYEEVAPWCENEAIYIEYQDGYPEWSPFER